MNSRAPQIPTTRFHDALRAHPKATAITLAALTLTALTCARFSGRDLGISAATATTSQLPPAHAARPHTHSESELGVPPMTHNPFARRRPVADPQMPALTEAIEHTEPLEAAPLEQPALELRLGAIMLAATPVAVINGRPCRVGDSIQSLRVIEIRNDGVILEGPGGTTRLSRE